MFLLPGSFRGMGAWRKTMELQKPGNSPGSGPEVVETESRQRVSGAESVAGQCRMRGVLGRVSTGAAGRILSSANPRDKNLKEGCVRCSLDERGHSEHDEGGHSEHDARPTDIARSFRLIVQLHGLIHIGKWTKLFRQVTLQVK